LSGVISFEVMIYKDAHWSIAFITEDREEALAEAQKAAAGKYASAVKVIQQTNDDETGEGRSKTIYTGGVDDASKPKATRRPSVPKADAGAPGHGDEDSLATANAKAMTGKAGDGKGGVTNLIDRIRKSIIVFGLVGLFLVILAFAYVSNPGAVSGFLDSMFN